ncbi:hypothetical protein DER46DRAFT_628779 [Fusarium sp. MPI-SDFR-AT-0072]|nr:hypothetical protein DER46DRAFT_628779 [Fusarium sp. MPI-SDFR-AT-0072]
MHNGFVASELDHPAKKIKSDNSNNNDKVSTRDRVPTTPRTRKVLSRQPITDSDDLPETTREQFDYSTPSFNLVDQINAINSDGPFPPSFTYAPPPMNIIVGHDMHRSDIADDCEENGCDKIVATSLARKAALCHNREAFGWWVRKIARSETLLRLFKGSKEVRRQFLSADVYVGELTVRVSGM